MTPNSTQMIIAPTDPSGSTISLDLGPIYRAEARVAEVQAVTLAKAPELLSVFNKAYLDLSKMIRYLEGEYLRALRIAKKRRSVIILDEAREILVAKGLATTRSPGGSADLREALLDGDDEYQLLQERAETIQVYRELLNDKRKGIEMAYHSVKRIISQEGAYRNVHLNGTMPQGEESLAGVTLDDVKDDTGPTVGPWGQPVY